MIAVLHRHRRNVQLLLDARADPWKTTPIVSLCDHPWYWFGFLSRHESVNVVQISFVQGPEDTVADLLPNDAQTQQSAGETAHPSFDDTAIPRQPSPEVLQHQTSSNERVLYVAPMATCFGRPLPACLNQRRTSAPCWIGPAWNTAGSGRLMPLTITLVARISKGVSTRCRWTFFVFFY